MTPKQQLFERFPLDGSVVVAGEELSTPYHIYNGTMLSLGGTVEGDAAARLLAKEHLKPVLDSEGRALAAIWICDFIEANLGAHHELQISLFATAREAQPLPAGAFSYHRALTAIPDLMMVCHGLWNNTERVVRYNREHLLLNAKLAQSDVNLVGDPWTFQFRDAEGRTIAGGSLPAMRRQPPAAVWKIARQMGFRGMLSLLRSPVFNMSVVNTRQEGSERNHCCQTYTVCQKSLIRAATEQDRIAISHPIYRDLDFKVTHLQQLHEIGFIFLRPSAIPSGA